MNQRVLFVCTGNICRSPTAEGVFRHLVEEAGLSKQIDIDSCGTHGYHAGEAPDRRSIVAAAQRGYRIDDLRARKLITRDFEDFDLLLAMDGGHLVEMHRLAPPGTKHKIMRFLRFCESRPDGDVPDPYYGQADHFEEVVDLVEEGARGLLHWMQQERQKRTA